ncbi:hypothetical protein TRVL_02213 [Trypanosoma vivax]|nr:hypothetical protein TRVL_02213 [Trypanosoma vivax]
MDKISRSPVDVCEGLSLCDSRGDSEGASSGEAERKREKEIMASLATAATDTAMRFCESMRRLWSVYFDHVYSEGHGLLKRVDEAFHNFEENPGEEALTNFLVAHQMLLPFLQNLFGANTTKGSGAEESVVGDAQKTPAGTASKRNALPTGTPLDQEATLVHHLSLCIAESISPVLAIALHESAWKRKEGSKEGVCKACRLGDVVLDKGATHCAMESARQPENALQPQGTGSEDERRRDSDLSVAHSAVPPSGGAVADIGCTSQVVDTIYIDDSVDECGSDGVSSSPVDGHRSLSMDIMSTRAEGAFAATKGVMTNIHNRPLEGKGALGNVRQCADGNGSPSLGRCLSSGYSSWSSAKELGVGYTVLHSGTVVGSTIANNSVADIIDKQCYDDQESVASTTYKGGLSDFYVGLPRVMPDKEDGRPPDAFPLEELEEKELVSDKALDPHLRLRLLKEQERALSALLLSKLHSDSRREDGGEARCYAMKKRLARLRSALLHTEREVQLLTSIQVERRLIELRRAERDRRLMGRRR